MDNLEVNNPPEGVDLKATLYNPDCKENCQANYHQNVKQPYLWREQAPHAVTRAENRQITQQISTQVERLSSQEAHSGKRNFLDETTKQKLAQQNQAWQNKFKEINKDSVWQYYKLIGTQWLQNPLNDNIYDPFSAGSLEEFKAKIRQNMSLKKERLLNMAMEAYVQNQPNINSCIGCHVNARRTVGQGESPPKVFSDFSFLLERAKNQDSCPESIRGLW
ncbi:MAG: hypothetical protein F6K47_41515 [Symploca sp. SIO2E6]|nr:hypothetical protein [Symploca sp. SIO2E6]